MRPHIVLLGTIPELARKDVKQLSATPSFFAVGVVCEVIRHDLSQAIIFVVWSRPRIARGNYYFRWGLENLRRSGFQHGVLDNGQGHADGRQTASSREICEDAR